MTLVSAEPCGTEVLSCAGGTLFAADGIVAGAEGTLLGGPLLAEVCTGPAGDVFWIALVCGGAGTDWATLDNGPELVEVTQTKVLVLPPIQELQPVVTVSTRVATTVVNM